MVMCRFLFFRLPLVEDVCVLFVFLLFFFVLFTDLRKCFEEHMTPLGLVASKLTQEDQQTYTVCRPQAGICSSFFSSSFFFCAILNSPLGAGFSPQSGLCDTNKQSRHELRCLPSQSRVAEHFNAF